MKLIPSREPSCRNFERLAVNARGMLQLAMSVGAPNCSCQEELRTRGARTMNRNGTSGHRSTML